MSSSKYNNSHPKHQLIVDFPAQPRKQSASLTSVEKKVSFSDYLQTHHHHYIVENDDEMTYSSWYEIKDYSHFRRSIRSDTRAFRRVLARNEDLSRALETSHDITAVGIIHLASREVMARVTERRETHQNAVLREHRRQVQEGNVDLDLLGYISSMHSKKSKAIAAAIAQNL